MWRKVSVFCSNMAQHPLSSLSSVTVTVNSWSSHWVDLIRSEPETQSLAVEEFFYCKQLQTVTRVRQSHHDQHLPTTTETCKKEGKKVKDFDTKKQNKSSVSFTVFKNIFQSRNVINQAVFFLGNLTSLTNCVLSSSLFQAKKLRLFSFWVEPGPDEQNSVCQRRAWAR